MTSRREFLGASLALGVAACAGGGRPKREIVDAQVHLWPPNTPALPWVPGAKPQLAEPFTIEKALALMDEGGIDRVVIVPPTWTGVRNDYALEAVRRYPQRFAVMGRVPQNDPKAAALFAAWREQPGMLGLRLTFFGPSAAWLGDGTSDWIWPAAEKARLPVMFLALQIEALARIAERHPDLALIIDHMGLTLEAVAAGHKQRLIDTTVGLAKYPNVSVKLSGTPAYATEAYPFHDMDVPLRRVFEAYGPQRCYWGTDITNSFAKATWRQRVEHFEALPFLSEEDKNWILGRGIRARLGWT